MQRQEALQQAYEMKRMAIEDYISSLPPLSKPPTVKLARANETAMWLRWARVFKNSYGNAIDPSTITYCVYMAGGFVSINVGDKVLCTPPPKPETPLSTARDENSLLHAPSDTDSESDSDLSSLDSPMTKNDKQSFRGEVIGMKKQVGFVRLFDHC